MIASLLCITLLHTDFGADLRIRQEMMDNVPGLPAGGVLSPVARGDYKNHIRFRPRVWGEWKGRLSEADTPSWRLFARLTDEFRWYANPSGPEPYSWPDEVIIDNLFLELNDLFDGLVDLSVGRQDLYGLYGLDHVFVDGTPGDGSRTTYADMVRLAFKFDNDRRLDLFALYDFDDNVLRWGTERGKHRSLSGLGGGAEPDMDDWGFGAIWSDKFADDLPYKAFLMQKNTAEYIRGGVQHPWTQRELVGASLMPRLDEEWSLRLEGMGQVGVNGEGATLSGWSGYAGVNWKEAHGSIRPFGKAGYHFMSGDDDAATEDGGHSAWDPMWARGVNDSELFLYGTHYGAAWWSNMHYAKLELGLEFSKYHKLVTSCGPLFAAAQDGMGGGNGFFKGLLSQIRYDFPLFTDAMLRQLSWGEHDHGCEIFGHILAEFFNPGDYYETEKPSWFVRWQIDFRF